MNELDRRALPADTQVHREPRRAVLTFLFTHDYQTLRDQLENPATPAQAKLALSELQNLKARLIQEMEGRRENAHHIERNYYQDLLRSIDLDIQGFSFRAEQQLPSLEEQSQHILDAMYSGRFNLAQDWLDTLWQQPDGRALHLQLDEELSIVEDVFETDFVPERSLLSRKITSNLDGLPFSDIHHLPQYIDKQRGLLELLERIKPLAENRGWSFEWSAMRNHVLRSVDQIHDHATHKVMTHLAPSFEELTEAKDIAQGILEELKQAAAHLETLEDQLLIEDQKRAIEQMQLALAEHYQELEILQISLGSENIETIEFLEEEDLEQLRQEIHEQLKPLERIDRTIRQHITQAERDIMLKVSQFFSKRDTVGQLKAQRSPIESQLHYLKRKLEAIQTRRNNQELLKRMHAIHRLDIQPIKRGA